MSNLILPNRFTSQPPASTLVDQAKAKELGVVYLAVANESGMLRDVIGGKDIVNPGGSSTGHTGRVWTFSGAQQSNKAITLAGEASLFVCARIKATAAQAGVPGAAFGVYNSGAQSGFGVGFSGSNQVGLAWITNAGAGIDAYSTGALNAWYDVYTNLETGSVGKRAWINGRPATTTQGSSVGNWITGQNEIAVGAQHRSSGFLRNFTGHIEWAAVLILDNAKIDDALSARLYADRFPYNLFKSPARRLWVGAAGGLTLIPSLYTDPDAFYSPTVSPGAVTLSPSLFTDSNTFYSPTVTPGSITLSPNLLVDADTFYSATVMPGGVNLAPALLSSTNTFYSPTVSAGSVNISPSLFNDADTFYIPTVSLDGSPQTLTPSLFADADTFHSATVAAGGVTLNPSLFVDADTFYIPTASLDGAPQNLTPSLYVDADTFYSPVVSSSGSQNLSPGLFVDADIFYSFSMVNGGFAKRGEYDNSQSVRRMHIQESKRSNIQT